MPLHPHPLSKTAHALALAAALLAPAAHAATTPQEQLAGYAQAAKTPGDASRGQQFFTTRHGAEWSCSSCHTDKPTVDGKHAVTSKRIGPLAPAFNAERFTDEAKTEKWFRRNCKDVAGRECTPGEKADVLAWLLTLTR